tara:strand:- start:277 stop:906 length:630 start_codon:yes stop_codon:yes gene_type:complete
MTDYKPAYAVNSKHAKSYEKTYKKFIKKQIDDETKFRVPFERMNDLWGRKSLRGQCLEMANYDPTGLNVMISNANGIQGNHKYLKDLCEEEGVKDKASYDKFEDMFHSPIAPSRWKEKFYRYISNRDKVNAIKYHEKLSAFGVKTMDAISEDSSRCGVYVDNTINDEEDTYASGDKGYMDFCAEMKRAYENRSQHIKFIDDRISRWGSA